MEFAENVACIKPGDAKLHEKEGWWEEGGWEEDEYAENPVAWSKDVMTEGAGWQEEQPWAGGPGSEQESGSGWHERYETGDTGSTRENAWGETRAAKKNMSLPFRSIPSLLPSLPFLSLPFALRFL